MCLVNQALRMAWTASPRDTLATITLNLLGGVFTAFGLLATTGVLTALFSQGPTLDRVLATLPSLAPRRPDRLRRSRLPRRARTGEQPPAGRTA